MVPDHQMSPYGPSQNEISSEQSQPYSGLKPRQLEEMLHRTEVSLTWYRTLYESIPSIYFTLNSVGIVRSINPLGAARLGYTAQELCEKPVFSLFHPQDQTKLEEAFAAFSRSSILVGTWEFRLCCKDGNIVWVKASAYTVPGADTNLIALNCEDISEQRQGEQESECFFALSLDLLCIAGFDGYFKHLNPAWEKLLGVTREELLSKPFIEFVHSDDRAITQAELERIIAGADTINFENRYRCQDGSYVWISWRTKTSMAEQVVYAVARDITHQKRVEAALRESEERYRRLVDLSPETIFLHIEEKFAYVNPAGAKLFDAASPKELEGRSIWDLVHPDSVEIIREQQKRQDQEEENPKRPFEAKIVRLDGQIVDVESVGISITYQGKPARQVFTRDITKRKQTEKALQKARDELEIRVAERTAELRSANEELQNEIAKHKQTEAALRQSEERYALAVQGANDGIWDWNLQTNEVYFSTRWKSMLGYEEHEVGNGLDECYNRMCPEDIQQIRTRITAHIEGLTSHYESEHRMRHKDGTYRWMLNRGLAIRDTDGKPCRMAGSQTDITNRKVAEEQLVYDAFHDALTGLSNRALFMDRLEQTIERAKRRENHLFAVLFLDLDRFKVINDSLGHNVGDQLLIAFARRLVTCMRSEYTVARLGGDEFVILLEDITDVSSVTRVVERIQAALVLPFNLSGDEVFTTTSIGITLSTTSYDQPQDLLRDADIALYRAKSLGRARYVVFDPVMHTQALTRLQIENDLRRAIEREEFQVYYQPIVELETGKFRGFEALVRWQHPNQGLVSPEVFIPVAEETGLIGPIGYWVLREACGQLQVWQERFAKKPLTISVNLSSKQFSQPDLVLQIDEILQETGLDARSLSLEVTESMIMENNEATTTTLLQLRDLGVQLSIDDFGTGYSSLGRLHRFPINLLKIDRSFVSEMDVNQGNLMIIKAIVTLAHQLGMDVIAEGVETAEQLAQLSKLKCKYGQGYLFSRPVDTKAAEILVATKIW